MSFPSLPSPLPQLIVYILSFWYHNTANQPYITNSFFRERTRLEDTFSHNLPQKGIADMSLEVAPQSYVSEMGFILSLAKALGDRLVTTVAWNLIFSAR